jgi:hypothetical protein
MFTLFFMLPFLCIYAIYLSIYIYIYIYIYIHFTNVHIVSVNTKRILSTTTISYVCMCKFTNNRRDIMPRLLVSKQNKQTNKPNQTKHLRRCQVQPSPSCSCANQKHKAVFIITKLLDYSMALCTRHIPIQSSIREASPLQESL